ncbi:hypothetical protein SeLEV6574_g08307 [Synchytrium endobioticum]|uniref:Uncharacterized protein n=1 Tax=Synchytrium endobioticum TaxID=286115 RepID=A0A507C9N9_9FUNG|nr:hypothetical protein SeLEV6574_g08307 [Synchytrium endobioticum]
MLSVVYVDDIAVSVSILSQFCHKPSICDWSAVKRILRYLQGTKSLKLVIGGKDPSLKAYSDADWAGDRVDRKSRSGSAVFYGTGLIVWNCGKQECVATSTVEAEYIALANTAKDVLWSQQLLGELGRGRNEPTTILEDNNGCKQLAVHPTTTSRTKHIDIKYHFIRDLVVKKMVSVERCPTTEMIADILTKPLSPQKFEQCRKKLGLVGVIASKGSVKHWRRSCSHTR